jgi:hypothetical protein
LRGQGFHGDGDAIAIPSPVALGTIIAKGTRRWARFV